MSVRTESTVTPAASLVRPHRLPNPQLGSGGGTISSRSTTLVAAGRTGPPGLLLSETHSQRSATSTATPTYSVDRFLQQDVHDDGTLHGRAATRTANPHPDIYILLYEARAIKAFVDFDEPSGRV
ncbi:hypothetical protein C8A05DRAFT_37072 [Staphylotrichum tortipilum]|uniref:Uncharacterized protein n=1 Tax=Staphylotrichum tortipilum TaxID=2831512 RepID=A0AAN6MFM2_9PEZI|nr:hypothetical protein C8A05DRAFT_37072 [Staphylotrichum longicolle]